MEKKTLSEVIDILEILKVYKIHFCIFVEDDSGVRTSFRGELLEIKPFIRSFLNLYVEDIVPTENTINICVWRGIQR